MEQMLPLRVGGYPGQFLVPREQPASTHSPKGFPWYVMTTADRVILAQFPLNQRVTKQAQDGDALVHRCVGEAPTPLDREHFGPLWIGASPTQRCTNASPSCACF